MSYHNLLEPPSDQANAHVPDGVPYASAVPSSTRPNGPVVVFKVTPDTGRAKAVAEPRCESPPRKKPKLNFVSRVPAKQTSAAAAAAAGSLVSQQFDKRTVEERLSFALEQANIDAAALSELVDVTSNLSIEQVSKLVHNTSLQCVVLLYHSLFRIASPSLRESYLASGIPPLTPVTWPTLLSSMLHVAGDSRQPSNLTVWKVERQLTKMFSDVLKRSTARSPAGPSPVRLTLDTLAEALFPDVYAVRLCEYVIGWVKRNRKKAFEYQETESCEVAIEDEVGMAMEACESEPSDLPSVPTRPKAEPRTVSAWRPPVNLEARLVAANPEFSAVTIEHERLQRRSALANREGLSAEEYEYLAKCSQASFARHKQDFIAYLDSRCVSSPTRFPTDVLECLGALGSEFVYRLVQRAHAFPNKSTTPPFKKGDPLFCCWIPLYRPGDLVSLCSDPAGPVS